MRTAVALTLLLSGALFGGGALSAVRGMRRGLPAALTWPPFAGYLAAAAACVGEAGWLLSGGLL